ncbi:MAG: hypothetical protein RL113_1273 [Pseudomonadota bacterium]|jgi:tyrosine-protein phosphatase YwqE
MFSFLRKKKNESIVKAPPLKIDLHSHLIPGIDDGAKTLEESLSLLQSMKELGYERVITTPHIMLDSYRNTPEGIRSQLDGLRVAAKEAKIDIEIDAAAEYYLDDGFLDHLHSGNLLSIGECILIETSYIVKPMQFEEMIFEMSAAGYKPILAHPERYRYIKQMPQEYEAMKEKGIYFQLNLNSLGGYYGKDAKAKAEFLSNAGMVDFVGSDIHSMKQIEALKAVKETPDYHRLFQHNTILNDTLLNLTHKE